MEVVITVQSEVTDNKNKSHHNLYIDKNGNIFLKTDEESHFVIVHSESNSRNIGELFELDLDDMFKMERFNGTITLSEFD